MPYTNTTVGAGDDNSGTCGGGGVEDKAFHWVAPAAGLYRFNVVSSVFTPAIYVEEGPQCGGALLGCNAAVNGTYGTEVVRELEAGQVLTVIVDGVSGSGSFTLDIEEVPGTSCPESSSVINLTTCTTLGSVCIADQTLDGRLLAPTCAPAVGNGGFGTPLSMDDMSYLWQVPGISPPSAGFCGVRVDAEGDTSFVVYVLQGGDCSGPELDCVEATDTDSDGVYSAYVDETMLVDAQDYVLVVADDSWMDVTSFDITLMCGWAA